jgi:hypothetical protein
MLELTMENYWVVEEVGKVRESIIDCIELKLHMYISLYIA